ncbi:MAG: LysM peptidoglycan-binding domain-containing protein [Chloroflexi bacterium]|nr:LysM peptidoglycan-binding domain-containing protein [Chloroflexota bacterium]
MNTQKQIVLIVALFFIFVGGCAAYTVIDLPYRAENQTQWSMDESVERGALLFANNCRTCHGIKGEGGIGLPLNTAAFKNQDPLVLKANQELLRTTIMCGRAGTLMPAWANTLGVYPNERAVGGALNLRQIDHLVDLITAPIDPSVLDAEGNPVAPGWEEAVHFAENLNHESTAIISGDTLDSIAAAHNVGPAQLAALNGVSDPNALLKKGTKLKIPASLTFPSRTYEVKKDNETIAKVAASTHVGAVLIADDNGLKYRIDKKSGDFVLLNAEGNPVYGLFPGLDKLRLIDGAVYAVRAGDTVGFVATIHGTTVAALTSLNAGIIPSSATADTELPFERTLKLPAGASVIIAKGDSFAALATEHKLTSAQLTASSGVSADGIMVPGTKLKLPDNAVVLVQGGDSYDSVAAAHGMTVDELLKLNNLDGSTPLDSRVLLKLPKIDGYIVQGQTLEDVAKGYSNVTASSLAEANKDKNPNLTKDSIVRVGTVLSLPHDAWGTAPPTTPNSGTACVQHAVGKSMYDQITGAVKPVTKPTTVSKAVDVVANANDWTLTADGTAQAANQGVALIAKGTAVKFLSKTGVHTITIGGKKDGADLKQGDERTITFGTAGEFKITCDYHPDMKATIFVE